MQRTQDDERRPLNKRELEQIAKEIMEGEAEDITCEMAIDSEDGGDSDAEDYFPETYPSNNFSKGATRRSEIALASKQTNTEAEACNDFDSDNSVSDEAETIIRVGNSIKTSEKIYEWSKSTKSPEQFYKAKFTEHTGATNDDLNTDSPLSIFLKLFPERFIMEIVAQTNLYIRQTKKHETFSEVSLEELKAFFGIVVVMGIHKLPSMKLYWANDENFHVERVARIMPVKRFLFILRHLHLNDNSKAPVRGSPRFDKLYKLRPMIDVLKTTFFEAYLPSRNISIDESMIGFKGRSTMKQYLPMKPVKRGFKMWACCCAEKGYILNFDLYTGKSENSGGPLGENVIKNLSRPYAGKNYCLFFDNYFSSISLVDNLLSNNLFACGTIRSSRKQYPCNLKSDRDLTIHMSDYAQSGDIGIVKWKDRGNKSVSVITTMHDPSDTTNVLRRDKKGNRLPVICPQAIATYNKYMGGVDLFDQYMSFYSVQQKSRRWWLKVFYYLLDATIVNSFIIYNCTLNSKKMKGLTHLQFRSKLVNELTGTYSSRKHKGYAPETGCARKRNCPDGRQTVKNIVRLINVGDHMPEKITTYRRCAHCSTKKKEKRSNMICKMCNVALCKDCFSVFHKRM